MSKALNHFLSGNPFCLLSISCNADELEIINAKEKLSKLAKLGIEKTYRTPFYNSGLPELDRSVGVVQSTLSTIYQPHHRLFWFESPDLLNSYVFSNNFENFMEGYNQVIYYDYFLLHYLQLILMDKSILVEPAWKKFCSLIHFYEKNSNQLHSLLHSRGLYKASELFLSTILNPLQDLIDELDLEPTIRLLTITSEFKGTAFDQFHQKAVEILITKIEKQILSIVNMNISEKETRKKEIIIGKELKKFCIEELKLLLRLSVLSEIQQDQIKDILYENVKNIAIKLYDQRDYINSANCIEIVKNYIPSYRLNEENEIISLLTKLKNGQVIVKKQISNNELSVYNERLYNNKDQEVQKLFLYAIAGDSEFAFILGNIYFTPINSRTSPVPIEYNPTCGIQWFTKAANEDHSKALFALGLCYFTGENVNKNLELADRLLKKAAMLGNNEAKTLLNSPRYISHVSATSNSYTSTGDYDSLSIYLRTLGVLVLLLVIIAALL